MIMAKTNKLEKLYQTVANCEELGLDLPNGVIDQITAMEEQLIKGRGFATYPR